MGPAKCDSPPALWPVNTNLVYSDTSNKLKLMPQHALVRVVIQDAIENVRASILFTDAFPDASLSMTFAKDGLITAAKAHLPASHNIHARLIGDSDYVPKIIPLVRMYN